jgi:Zn-dependent protease with chaperone function
MNAASIKCPDCGNNITAGKDGMNQQIKYFIENKKFNFAIYLHRFNTGDSLAKSKLYVQNLSNSMGIQMKTSFRMFGLALFSFFAGLILTFIFSLFYPKVVYLISNDLLGLKIRGVTSGSFIIAVLFYSILIFILLLIRRFISKQKQVKPTAQSKPPEQTKIPQQKDFRGNAF